jgi:murein DD-endopeptidase MepM/ murein hydrolase activator NlpD
VKRFGRQKHPTVPHIETTNSGIDMQTAPGAAVLAVFDGEVSAVFRPDGYNNVIVIRHGQYMTVYANLGSITVSTGQKVKAGQNLGTVYTDANDGNRSVLHFEIRNRREKEDPELWLKR